MKLKEMYKEIATSKPHVSDISNILGIPSNGIKIMVVTNRNAWLGAVNIFIKDVQDEVSRELDATEFIVIPSSKHQVLCVRLEFAKSKLVQMITEVNQRCLAEDERLDPVPYICNTIRHTLREM